jgi:hypothetical protein
MVIRSIQSVARFAKGLIVPSNNGLGRILPALPEWQQGGILE